MLRVLLYRNKDREIEDIEEKHQDEIKVYKQKLKLLMYEQHVHLSEVQVSCFIRYLFSFSKTVVIMYNYVSLNYVSIMVTYEHVYYNYCVI